jgi:hypothetical protein
MGRSSPVTDETYTRLCEAFTPSETFTLSKGGADLTYITSEAVTTRLNTVLGVDGWEFGVVEHGHDETHAWVLGRLTVRIFDDRMISRSQFGECSIQKGMAIGDARKGACSDALKKCASLFGVGLYLSRKEEQQPARRSDQALQMSSPTRWDADGNVVGGTPTCEVCGEEITDRKRKDGSIWFASEVAEYSRKTCNGRVLCYEHSRNAG